MPQSSTESTDNLAFLEVCKQVYNSLFINANFVSDSLERLLGIRQIPARDSKYFFFGLGELYCHGHVYTRHFNSMQLAA
jgi:hypothetical protein